MQNFLKGSGMNQTDRAIPGQPLDLALPPMLVNASGYTGEARFVALYWGIGDELYVNDGARLFTGDWMVFHYWRNHMSIHSHLASYDLGSCEAEARHWLVVDCEQERIYAIEARSAAAFLRTQWKTPDPTPVPLVIDRDTWKLLAKEVRQRMQAVSPSEIQAALHQQEQWYREIQLWLEQQAHSSAAGPLV